MKYEITSGIAATNTIPDVVYGDYDVVATPADGYTATANPAKLTVNAATASAKIITAETKTFTLTPSLDTYIKSDAADATHASDTVLLVNQSNPSSGATGGAALMQFDISDIADEGYNLITKADLELNAVTASWKETDSNTHAGQWWNANVAIVPTADDAWSAETTWTNYTKKINTNKATPKFSTDKGGTDKEQEPAAANYKKYTADMLTEVKAETDGKLSLQISTTDARETKIASMEDTANAPKLVVVAEKRTLVDVPVEYKYGDGQTYTPSGSDQRPTSVKAIEGMATDATDAMKAAFTVNGTKYVLDEDNEDNVFTVTPTTEVPGKYVLNFRVAKKYTLKTTAIVKDSSPETVIKNYPDVTNVNEGDSTNMPYSRYIIKDNKLYTVAQKAIGNNYYTYDIAPTGDNLTIETKIPYTEVSGVTPVYFAEAEDIASLSPKAVNNDKARASYGSTASVLTTDTTILTLGAGTYTFEAAAWGSTGRTYTFTIGEKTLTMSTNGSFVDTASNNDWKAEVTLSEPTDVKVKVSNDSGVGLDYFLVKGTGTATAVPDVPTLKPAVLAGGTDDDPAGDSATKYELTKAADVAGFDAVYTFSIEGLKKTTAEEDDAGTNYFAGVTAVAPEGSTITGFDWSDTDTHDNNNYGHEPGKTSESVYFDASQCTESKDKYLFVELDDKYNYKFKYTVTATIVEDTTPVNLLKNPGFEGSEWAAADTDWKYSDSTGKWQGHGTVTRENVTSSAAKEGDYVAKLDTNEVALGQKVALESGKTYKLTAWVKGSNATDTIDVTVREKDTNGFPASGTVVLDNTKTTLTEEWKEVSGTFTASASDTYFVYFYSKGTADESCGVHTAPIYIDNVSLVETDAE